MAFRTKCSSKTTQKCRLICDHSKKIRVNGALIDRMLKKSTMWIIATRLQGFLAPVDNFESGLFPPDLLLPTHPGRTFEPPIYNSWLKPENEERKNLKIRNQTR